MLPLWLPDIRQSSECHWCLYGIMWSALRSVDQQMLSSSHYLLALSECSSENVCHCINSIPVSPDATPRKGTFNSFISKWRSYSWHTATPDITSDPKSGADIQKGWWCEEHLDVVIYFPPGSKLAHDCLFLARWRKNISWVGAVIQGQDIERKIKAKQSRRKRKGRCPFVVPTEFKRM